MPNGYTASSRYEQEFTLDGYIDRSVFTAEIEGKEVNVKLSSTLADNHYIKYEVDGVPDSVTEIKFPTWSINGEQDDIGLWQADRMILIGFTLQKKVTGYGVQISRCLKVDST